MNIHCEYEEVQKGTLKLDGLMGKHKRCITYYERFKHYHKDLEQLILKPLNWG